MTEAPRPPAKTSTMARLGLGIAVVFALLLAAGAVPRLREQRALAAAADKARSTPRGVYVFRAARAPAAELKLTATTQAMKDAVIYARTSGYIKRRLVDIGDRVSEGQLLAEIESPEVDQELRQARAALLGAQKTLDQQRTNLSLARVTMGRYKAAAAEGAVAFEALDESVTAFRAAESSVAGAEANVESNRANVERLVQLIGFQRVLAPFDGTVIQRNVDVGTLITAGSPTDNTAIAPSSLSGAPNGLFQISDVDTIRVFVNVPQAFAGAIHPGFPVKVTVRGRLEEPFQASVTRTASALDPSTRTLLTEIDLANGSHRLMPGTFAYAEFKLEADGLRWRLPATAVVVDASGTRVATVTAEKRIHFLPVVLGRDFGAAFDVQAGLSGDEWIVTQPSVALKEGQSVRPIERPYAP